MLIGTNLYSFGEQANSGLDQLAYSLKKIGIDCIEPLVMPAQDTEMLKSPYVPKSVWGQEDFKPRIKRLKEQWGLDVYSCHIGIAPFDVISSKVDDLLRLVDGTEVRQCVVSHEISAAEDCRKQADVLSLTAERLAKVGVSLLYHTHEHEMAMIDVEGERLSVIDYLLKLSDPSVKLQVDVGWVRFAGVDEVEFLKNHRARIGSIHLKDFKPNFDVEKRQSEIVAVGTGILRLPEVLAEAAEMGLLDNLVIDQDFSSGSLLDDLAVAVEKIRRWNYAEV